MLSFFVADPISVEVMGSASIWAMLNTEVVSRDSVEVSVSRGSGRREKPSALACSVGLNCFSY